MINYQNRKLHFFILPLFSLKSSINRVAFGNYLPIMTTHYTIQIWKSDHMHLM